MGGLVRMASIARPSLWVAHGSFLAAFAAWAMWFAGLNATANALVLQRVSTTRYRENAAPFPPDAIAWRDVPCPQGHAEFVFDADSRAEIDLLISAFAAARTSTTVSIEVSLTELAVSIPSGWNTAPPSSLPANFRQVKNPAAPTPVEVLPDGTTRIIFWPTTAPGERSTFAAQPVRCRELCRGRRIAVFWDDSAIDDNAAEYGRNVVELLDGLLLSQIEAAIGSCNDVDGDGRLMVAVSPRLQGGTNGLSAFVRAADFQPDGALPGSNRADVIYLAPQVPLAKLQPILMHELAHVAQFSQWRRNLGTDPWPLPDWLLEGQAHAAEACLTGCWTNLERRFGVFCERPEACPLVIVDAAAAGRWRDSGSRGATAAFCLWLTERYGTYWWRGLSRLASDDEERWNREFGRSFSELYREWTVALAASTVNRQTAGASSQEPQLETLQPRRHMLRGDSTTPVTLTGTATAYCRLPKARRLRIALDSGNAPLQVTLVRHPADDDASAVVHAEGIFRWVAGDGVCAAPRVSLDDWGRRRRRPQPPQPPGISVIHCEPRH